MTPFATPEPSTQHRVPGEIISHAVWLSCRLPLSHRDVEELFFVRGVSVSYAAFRTWCRQCGQAYAHALRRRPRPGDTGHVDEVCVTLNTERQYRWRAVDQDGHGLDMLVQSRRNQHAAKQCFRKLLTGLRYVPRVIITDKLKSDGAAKREIVPGVEQRQHRSLNNRAEHSPQPTRQRERRMQGCKSPGHVQRFLAAYGPIAQHCRPRRHRWSAPAYRQERQKRCHGWGEITGIEMVASGRNASEVGPLSSRCCLQRRSA
jgi:putative transposase